MSSKQKQTCDHCGASMMANEYSMSRSLVRAMFKIKRNPGKPIQEIGLSKSEYANVSKLKFWEFAEKIEDGRWDLTGKGCRFLRGDFRTHKKVFYFRNKVIKTEGETNVFEVFPTYESKQKYREAMRSLDDLS